MRRLSARRRRVVVLSGSVAALGGLEPLLGPRHAYFFSGVLKYSDNMATDLLSAFLALAHDIVVSTLAREK